MFEILLPEYKNQEPDMEVTEVCEQAVGRPKCETGGQIADHQRSQ